MKTYNKILNSLVIGAASLIFCPVEGYCQDDVGSRLQLLEHRVSLLEKKNVICGPVTISEVSLGHQKAFVQVQPGQQVECSLHYALDSSQQAFLDKHYLVVGLSGVAAEAAVVHLYGVWDSKGTKPFTLVAPLQEGDYEVRAAYYHADTREEAFNAWNVLKQEPNSSTTIGILRVRAAQ